ncbi:MAG: hypothetical protein WC587_00980 [Candidatus Paceibacterota bacterium]
MDYSKLKKLEAEYLHLLKVSSQGEERIKLFESKSIPLEKHGEHIVFLENEIIKLKEELSSEGIIYK